MTREAERKRLVELTRKHLREELGMNIHTDILEKYADHLLDNGIGVKSHCEAGEIVYLAIESPKPQIKTKVIESIVIGILDDKIVFTDGTCFTIWNKDWDLSNNAIFTSREEAQKALKRKEDKRK